MSALAIQAAPLQTLDETRDDRVAADGFHGELALAKKNDPPKTTTIQPRRDRGKPAPRAQSPADSAAAPAPQPVSPQPQAAAKSVVDDVVAMISAGKSLLAAQGTAPAQVDSATAVAETAALEPTARASAASQALPMTPLEQAVHELIDRLREGSDKAPAHDAPEAFEPLPGATMSSASIDDAPKKPVAGPEAVREPEPVPENANPSHVHLVIDDGERLVLTVAVRGNEVVAHVRGDNEATAAALARNAGILDDSLRARGLNLAGFHTGHDHAEPQQHERPSKQREAAQPIFKLEENL